MFWNCMAAGAGGFIGSVMRYLVGMIPFLSRHDFPLQTLTVNFVGAFVIGLIAGGYRRLAQRQSRDFPQGGRLRRIHDFFDILTGIAGDDRSGADRSVRCIRRGKRRPVPSGSVPGKSRSRSHICVNTM